MHHICGISPSSAAGILICPTGLALVVVDRQLTALELNTGRIAAGWPLQLPEGSLPSGRGYHADGQYYLPLNVSGEGEVATFQLDPPRSSIAPGGLVARFLAT